MIYKAVVTTLMTFGSLIALCGATLGLVEVIRYLNSGMWAHHSLSWAVGAMPDTIWPRLNGVLEWLSGRPLWGVVTFAGLALALLGSSIE
jgi:hypothetical protein